MSLSGVQPPEPEVEIRRIQGPKQVRQHEEGTGCESTERAGKSSQFTWISQTNPLLRRLRGDFRGIGPGLLLFGRGAVPAFVCSFVQCWNLDWGVSGSVVNFR